MMGFGTGGGSASMWIMGVFGLLIAIGVIALVAWAIRSLVPRSRVSATGTDPLTQLQLRMARGEITPDEYEELRAHLRD